MKIQFGLLTVLGACLCASPVLAQTATKSSGQVAFDNLIAAGFEVRAVTMLSDNATKEVFSGQNLSSQVFVTLQNGKANAVCEFATSTWIYLDNTAMTDPTRCYQR